MRKTMTCWATCGLGLLLLTGAGCAPTVAPKNEAAATEQVGRPPSVEVHVLQVNNPKPAPGAEAAKEGVATAPQAQAGVGEGNAGQKAAATIDGPATAPPAAVAEAVPPPPPPATLARTPPQVYKYLPDASKSLGTENLLSEICKEVAGKVFYELKENGERHLVSRVAVVTAVPLSDLKRESEFGRIIGEYLLTDLADRGIKVTELRLGREINILPQTGEFILSRNIGELASDAPMLDYVVVSTFTNTRKTLILQGRLVGLKTGLVETSWRYTLPLNRELLGLFHEAEPPCTIPVKGMRR